MNDLLSDAARYASEYLASLRERRVYPSAEAVADLSRLGGELPDDPTDPAAALALLRIGNTGPQFSK